MEFLDDTSEIVERFLDEALGNLVNITEFEFHEVKYRICGEDEVHVLPISLDFRDDQLLVSAHIPYGFIWECLKEASKNAGGDISNALLINHTYNTLTEIHDLSFWLPDDGRVVSSCKVKCDTNAGNNEVVMSYILLSNSLDADGALMSKAHIKVQYE